MYIEELKILYKDMKSKNIDIQKFLVTHNKINFECTFSLRETPFTLSFTSLNKERVFVIFNIHNGFKIDTFLDQESYRKLANLFHNNAGSFTPFGIKDFLNEIKLKFPNKANSKNVPSKPQDILKDRKDIEEPDKIYFIGWMYHSVKGYSKFNLNKTYLAFGKEAKEYQIKNKASTKWSDKPTGKNSWKNS